LLDDVRWYGEPLAGSRTRDLLRALADTSPHGSSERTLIGAVWGDDPPANPTKALQVLVSRVRSTTSAQVIERTATGYRLGLEPEEVDVLALADLETTAHTALARDDLISASAAARRALEIGPSPRAGRVLAIA